MCKFVIINLLPNSLNIDLYWISPKKKRDHPNFIDIMDDANAAFSDALEHLQAAWDSAVENGGDRYINIS